MKLFGGMFRKKAVEETVAEKLKEQELEPLLKKKMSEGTEHICDDARPLLEGLPDAISNVNSSLDALEGAEIELQVKRPKQLILNARKHYAYAVRHSLEPVKVNGNDYEGIKKVDGQLSSALATIKTADAKHAKMIHFSFGAELGAVRHELNEVIRISKDLGGKISSCGKDTAEISGLLSMLGDLKAAREKLKTLQDDDARLQKDISELEEKAAENRKGHQDIEKSPESKEFAELEKTFEAKSARIKEIEQTINTQMHSLGRPLKKFRRLVEMDPKKASAVTLAESRPVAMLTEEFSINGLARELKQSIEKGQISLDAKEKAKSINRIESLLNSNPDKLRGQYQKAMSELAELERGLSSSSILKDKEHLKAEGEKLEKDLRDLRKQLEETKAGIPETKKEIENLKPRIESGMKSTLGKEVSIKWA
jgi:peptidoglycan hydrolase CwlO-like protein